jgi:large subunit ribosomal protein L18e
MSKLNRYTQKGDTAVVPGKVLGVGRIEHPLNVAAVAFSKLARTKILKAKGKCLSFYELMEKNPKGSQVKIIG